MKKRKSPCTPLRVKAKGKETSPGFFESGLSPRARTHASRYREAGAAAAELMDILGSRDRGDRPLWAYYCYRHDVELILEKARECASRQRQGEIRDAVTAFQRWLSDSFGES